MRGPGLIVLVAIWAAFSAVAAGATTLHPARSASSRTVDGTVLLTDGPAYTASPAPHGGTLIAESGSSYAISPPPSCPTTLTTWTVVGAGSALYDCRSSADDIDTNYEISTPPSDVWRAVDGSAVSSL